MTFLNPFILIGLIAAGIPLLLHLLNLRKLRTIEFSTLSFLKELQRTKIRRIKIQQWLLLLLRTLLVILVVMAFARPTLKGSLGGVFGERAKTTSVFILDDSQSMTALEGDGERFQHSKEAVLQVVELLQDGDEVFYLKLSDAGSTTAKITPTRNFDLLRSALQENKPSFHHAALEDVLRLSARLLSGSTNFNKEIFIFSDLQAGAITSKTASATARESLFPESARLYLVDSGERNPRNLGIESLIIPNSIFEAGKALTVQARITNESGTAVQNHIVSLFLSGERVAQRGVDIPAGSSATVDFTAVPKTAGMIEGFVELEHDDLEFDNRRYFTLNIPERVRVLLVGSSTDLQFIQLALSTRESSRSAALQIRESTTERMSTSNIDATDVVILAGPQSLSAVQAGRLEAFLSAGGGVVLFPGLRTEQNSFNAGVAEPIGIPLIINIESLQTSDSETESFVGFDRVEVRHPLFMGMFEEDLSTPPRSGAASLQRSVESPSITKLVRYQLPARSQTIITLSNGSSFLSELPLREGRLLLYSVAAHPDWSDFPLRGLFVPLLHRSVSYLAQVSAKQKDMTVGDEVTIRSRTRPAERWTISSPTGIETVVQPFSPGIESVIRFTETDEPGVYQLKHGATVEQKFAVNMHPDESKTVHANDEAVAAMFERLGIPEQSLQYLEAGGEIQEQVMQARFGVELWKHFLIAALMIAIAEMLVARESRQELAAAQVTTS